MDFERFFEEPKDQGPRLRPHPLWQLIWSERSLSVDCGNQVGGNLLRFRLAGVVLPRAPLVPDHIYIVSITTDSKEYKWSFTIGPHATKR
jgi:hypothetical protein